jgi:hypothetical protein
MSRRFSADLRGGATFGVRRRRHVGSPSTSVEERLSVFSGDATKRRVGRGSSETMAMALSDCIMGVFLLYFSMWDVDPF